MPDHPHTPDDGDPWTGEQHGPDHWHGPPWARHGPPWARGGPPPWWTPEQPGHGRRHGPPAHVRRRFLRGFVGVAALFLVVALGSVVAVVAIASRLLGDGPTGAAVAGAVALLVLLVILLAGLGAVLARRFAAPLADVMDAAARVRAGDTSARVRPRGPGDVRRLATTFNEMVERLDSDERRRRALLADLAHELRTPLSVVRGNVEGILDGVYDAEPERLRTVIDEVAVMERLLDDLTTLSTAEAGALRLEVEEVDLATVVAAAVRVVADRAADAGVELATSTDDALDVVEVDPVRVEQVLVNLLVNAIRHTPAGGHVEVAVTTGEHAATLTVADTGTGIDPEDLAHVFDRFVRSADSGGSGLGLAIARRLVEAHGGSIEARPREPTGTTMVVRLPPSPPGA